MKYISLDVSRKGFTRRLVFAFPNDVVHKDMADAMVSLLQVDGSTVCVHAAGEANIVAQTTYGSSGSLGVGADPKDANLFLMQDYGGNFL